MKRFWGKFPVIVDSSLEDFDPKRGEADGLYKGYPYRMYFLGSIWHLTAMCKRGKIALSYKNGSRYNISHNTKSGCIKYFKEIIKNKLN